jgi:quinol monooxygenase YgiN
MAAPCIVDCDPGHDDAVAMLLAAASDALDLRAITTVGGNGALDKVTDNARRICTLAGLHDVPIAAGAAQPLGGTELEVAADVHGESALDGPELPEPTVALDARDASAKKQLMEALQPIRISDYDERPYKPLTLAADKGIGGVRTEGVFVISHVDVAPNTEAPALLQKLADASRQEAGNLRFDVVQHNQRANHFTVVEHWQSQAALDTHVATAHARQYRDALQPLTGSPLDERTYTPIDPRVK